MWVNIFKNFLKFVRNYYTTEPKLVYTAFSILRIETEMFKNLTGGKR